MIIAQFFKCLPPNVVSMINLTDKLDDLDNIARLADCAIEQTVTCNSQTRPNDFDNFKNVITAQMQELCTQVSNLQMQHPAQSLQNVPTSNVRPLHRLPSSRQHYTSSPLNNVSNAQTQSYNSFSSTSRDHKSLSKPFSGQNFNEQGWCWYHLKYFENARHCLPGCTFKR